MVKDKEKNYNHVGDTKLLMYLHNYEIYSWYFFWD